MQLTFLEEIAERLHQDLGDKIGDYTIIFPNRRAGLFFNKALRKHIHKPIWAPETIAIEDFVRSQSETSVPDQLSLVFSLHEVFQRHAPFKEDFEQFYFWGEMLVKDFNDVDHYMADPKVLFANLRDWKQLSGTDFLTEEQIALIERFWKSFEAKPKDAQEKFSKNWDILYPVYADFKRKLNELNQAYNGLLYRNYVESLFRGESQLSDKLIFAGFNALTKTEEIILSEAVKNGAIVYWDLDEYYAGQSKVNKEAGNFFRDYRKHTILGKTFPEQYPNTITQNPPNISITEVKGNVAQAKFLGQLLEDTNIEQAEKTAIILGDESLLFPVLFALPEKLQKVNVTMGYPLKYASSFQLLNHCLHLQKNIRKQKIKVDFNHRDTLKLLKHPMISNILGKVAQQNIQEIEEKNIIRVNLSDLKLDENELLTKIFVNAEANYFSYLKTILQIVHKNQLEHTEQEFISELYKHIVKLEEIVGQFNLQLDINAFIRLFSRIIQSLRIPFSGEPLEGIQIMGVLESRNLDFENVFFLSMSEDNFPGSESGQSFIPYNIRKAYGLPTLEQRDAIYAYLFNRLLQRSDNMHLMYNSDNSGGKGGEPSRYLLQLQYEFASEVKSINQYSLDQDPKATNSIPITIPKNKEVKEILSLYGKKGNRTLSASALKIYLDCRLKFYFRYIAGLKEREEVNEELEAAEFGNILHHVMENLYGKYLNSILEKQDVLKLKKEVMPLIIDEFHQMYGKEGEDFVFEGRNIIIRDVIKRMVDRILDYDAIKAPLKVLEVEGEYAYDFQLSNDQSVSLAGSIDRLDQVGESIRVIDYKSGKDDLGFTDIPSLFDRDNNKRNGAAMQTLFYGYLYYQNSSDKIRAIVPGLYNGKELFNANFSENLKIDKKTLTDARPLMDEYEKELNLILEEIFVSNHPFEQTLELEKCQYCPFKTICNR